MILQTQLSYLPQSTNYFQNICKTTAASAKEITTAVFIVGFSSKYTEDKM